MQIGAQFPVVPNASGSRSAFPVQVQGAKTSVAPYSQPSPGAQFEGVSAQTESRFSRYGDFGANTRAALETYQATESLASNNPRHALTGVDVFA
ncbi:hypothetical protein [Marinomonas transparens]|uniref:Uncharacterized protein n=1 Tax=Marinomonas transparens TaxID=2795388 RepID=A0A934JLJ4_9GAMM|nr:hypothetical protein [Marinomonas transparens]MBJ7538380.1 hypothetical protein [Marinomonas transparens]